MPRTKLKWKQRAKVDLREIKAHIAKTAPQNAQSYVQDLKAAARRLKQFPEMGGIIDEFQDPEIRELVVESHRIVYRYHDNTIEIITIFHGARILRKKDLESD